jgi:hypothetical protein
MSDLVTNPRRPPPYEDLRVMIGRMDGKLDIVLHWANEHERRISALEAWKNKVLGWHLASAVGGGASALGADRLIQLFLNFR